MTSRGKTGKGDPPDNPVIFAFADTSQPGMPRLTLSIPYATLTGLLLPGTIVREAGCRWDTIAFGLGPDGRPNTSIAQIGGIPVGTMQVPLLTLANFLITTVTGLLAQQVTAYQG